MRRGSASIAANPVLIGAATTLVVLVAVFLAYNANSGLPFVPTYQLRADVPDAANLVVGNDSAGGSARAASAGSVPGYADTRRSDSLRQLDAYFHGKKLDLGDDAQSSPTGAAPAQQSAPAAAPSQQAAPAQQPASAAASTQPAASGDDPSSALLDYLLGGGG